MSDWQLIGNTTPHEKFVFVFGPDGMDLAEYLPFLGAWHRKATAEYSNEAIEVTTPTHWMLPDPPEAA